MINPHELTNFSRTDRELEEVALFSILVAGKNALTTAKILDRVLNHVTKNGDGYFDSLRPLTLTELQNTLRENGMGCSSAKARSIFELVHKDLNLRNCSAEELEEIYGIGSKTSRLFLLHTRKNMEVAVLDVHILRYLRDLGFKAPLSTPNSKSKYRELERIFLDLARKLKTNAAKLDLEIWRKYSNKKAAVVERQTLGT